MSSSLTSSLCTVVSSDKTPAETFRTHPAPQLLRGGAEVCFTTTWRQIWNIKLLLCGFLTRFFLSSRYFPAMRADRKLLLVGRWRIRASSIRLNHTSVHTCAVVAFFKPTLCGCTYWYNACIEYILCVCMCTRQPARLPAQMLIHSCLSTSPVYFFTYTWNYTPSSAQKLPRCMPLAHIPTFKRKTTL